MNVYSGFNKVSRVILPFWEKRTVYLGNDDKFFPIIQELNTQLSSGNVILFFDHHYAFDAVPLGLALSSYVDNVQGVIIPYAVHLDMGVGREGQYSLRYWFRTQAYHWFIRRITSGNPDIRFLPVAREFEMEAPRLRKIVDRKFQNININYLRTFIHLFTKNTAGFLCFLTPFSGIGFPGKPCLHPQLFKSVRLVVSKCERDVSFFITGAYPRWEAYNSYLAPLFIRHKVVIQGPFKLPITDFKVAKNFVEFELSELRKMANFSPPDYERILEK